MLSKASFATLVPINDMNRAIKFCTKALGGKVTSRVSGEMKDSWAAVKIGGEQFWLIKGAKKSDVTYSTFVVKDIKSTVAGLKEKGVRFLRAERESYTKHIEGPIAYHTYGAEAFFNDSDGNLFMLCQYL